jgi:hypothetical protein
MYPFANNIPETDRITELDTQIAELKQKIAQKKAAALQSKYDRMNDPDYRVARYDYIVSGDRSGLDRISEAERAYKNMLANQAHAKELAEAQRLDSQLYQMDEYMKNRSIAATKAQYAEHELAEANRNKDSAAIALAKQNKDIAYAELAYWNKRVGYNPDAETQGKTPQVNNDDTDLTSKASTIATAREKFKQNLTKAEIEEQMKLLAPYRRQDDDAATLYAQYGMKKSKESKAFEVAVMKEAKKAAGGDDVWIHLTKDAQQRYIKAAKVKLNKGAK